jgi:hypothetical protein
MLYVMICVVFEEERSTCVEDEEARVSHSCHLSWVNYGNRDYLICKLNKNWREYSF